MNDGKRSNIIDHLGRLPYKIHIIIETEMQLDMVAFDIIILVILLITFLQLPTNILLVYTFYRSSDFPRLGLACKRQNGYVNITTNNNIRILCTIALFVCCDSFLDQNGRLSIIEQYTIFVCCLSEVYTI